MNFSLILLAAFFAVCYAQDPANETDQKDKAAKFEKMCAMVKKPEGAEMMDKMQEKKMECMKKAYVSINNMETHPNYRSTYFSQPKIEEFNKPCWDEAFPGKPMPKKGSEMMTFMCDNKADMMKGGKGVFKCTIGKVAADSKDPEDKVKQTMKECSGHKSKPQ